MAKATKVVEETETAPEPVTETVTYVPGPLDPVVVKWAGHVFQANVPKEITGFSEGTEREKLNLHVIDSARNNKHFRVGNTRNRREPAALPVTSDEYRAYMVDWLKGPFEHADELIARLARDRELWTVCEVGHDDFAYLSTLFMPKLHDLARGDELSEGQVASLWITHGFNTLPW